MTALRLLHLYPAALGINGDAGNVLALRQRLHWRGLRADVLLVEAGQPMPHDVDLVHIGSGPRSARDLLLPDLRERSERLHAWAAAGVPMLGVGAGFQLMSRSIVSAEGIAREAAGLLPVIIRDIADRTVGEVLGMPVDGHRIAGYLNHAVLVERLEAQPLVALERGPAIGGVAGSSPQPEGVRDGDLVGTHLHGPVLPMNPALADDLLRRSLARHGEQLPPADDRVTEADERARRARAAIAARLGRAGVAV